MGGYCPDRHGSDCTVVASYLPQLFGSSQYALLPRSEHLPVVLLDWMKRLVSA